MIACVVVGLGLTVFTVGIHAVGTAEWVRRLQRLGGSRPGPPSRWASMRVLCETACFLLLLTVVEVVVWAFAYLAVPGLGRPDTLEEAVYFSSVTFTTLGYGDIVLPAPWRVLSGLQAITGLLMIGWSAAMLFMVVQKLWELRPLAEPTQDEQH